MQLEVKLKGALDNTLLIEHPNILSITINENVLVVCAGDGDTMKVSQVLNVIQCDHDTLINNAKGA